MNPNAHSPGPLAGLRVIDAATLFAGPTIATVLGDYGADVIKVEHPSGDPQRKMGYQQDGTSLWWTVLGRNKRSVTLDLHHDIGQRLFKELAKTADVVIENFRPGTLERWNLGYDTLQTLNRHLVMVRVTAFGQDGPYAHRPGFGTLAEAMSGFAHINGHQDGPPTLPPFALADSVAGIFGVGAVLAALYHRDHDPDQPGQYIDLSIYEALFWILGPQTTVYDKLGIAQGRSGNRAPFTCPRNAYQAKDGRWVVLSASTQSIAERVMTLVGASKLKDEPWFQSHEGRLEHEDELDQVIGQWVKDRTCEEIINEAEQAEVSIAPVYSIKEIFEDPQYRARETIRTITDDRLGEVKVQNVFPRLSETPGQIRHLGPPLGAHNREVLAGELGHSLEELSDWNLL